jgi:hypothetical protein
MVLRRFSIVSLKFLILATVAIIILVYLASPLRDPAFQTHHIPGSRVWWLKDMSEKAWVWSAGILAGMLAINSMLVLWTQRIVREIALLMVCGFLMWFLLFFVYLWYLLFQWLID